jgi:hypothetical protein
MLLYVCRLFKHPQYSRRLAIAPGLFFLFLVACGPLNHPVLDKPGTEKAVTTAIAPDLSSSYKFNSSQLSCVNAEGKIGYNQGTIGPCADLHGQTLSKLPEHVDLSGANLSGAIIDSDLSLSGAKLVGADLENVVYLQGDLSNADLSHANLVNANLKGTSLKGADLTDSILAGAVVDSPESSPSPSPAVSPSPSPSLSPDFSEDQL